MNAKSPRSVRQAGEDIYSIVALHTPGFSLDSSAAFEKSLYSNEWRVKTATSNARAVRATTAPKQVQKLIPTLSPV
jgi:hypothetical protein